MKTNHTTDTEKNPLLTQLTLRVQYNYANDLYVKCLLPSIVTSTNAKHGCILYCGQSHLPVKEGRLHQIGNKVGGIVSKCLCALVIDITPRQKMSPFEITKVFF